jgi:hypothetical protein
MPLPPWRIDGERLPKIRQRLFNSSPYRNCGAKVNRAGLLQISGRALKSRDSTFQATGKAISANMMRTSKADARPGRN